MKKKIVITGGTGRFGGILKKYKKDNLIFFPKKKRIRYFKLQKNYLLLRKKKTKCLNSFSWTIQAYVHT